MEFKFNKTRCLVFIVGLIGMVLLSQTYIDQMFEMSHQMIKDLQAGHSEDGTRVKFINVLEFLSRD